MGQLDFSQSKSIGTILFFLGTAWASKRDCGRVGGRQAAGAEKVDAVEMEESSGTQRVNNLKPSLFTKYLGVLLAH